MVKKSIVSIFTVFSIFTLSACDNNDEQNVADDQQNVEQQQETENQEQDQQQELVEKENFIIEALMTLNEYDETTYEERYNNVGNYFSEEVFKDTISQEHISPDSEFTSTIEIDDIYHSSNNENQFIAIYHTSFITHHEDIDDEIGTDTDMISEITLEEQDGDYIITDMLNTPKQRQLTDEEMELIYGQSDE